MKGKEEVIAIYKFIDSAINNYGEDKVLSEYINYTLWIERYQRNESSTKRFSPKIISNYEKI